eukprot:3594110-Lingulodinium_polyedra.AAC.1
MCSRCGATSLHWDRLRANPCRNWAAELPPRAAAAAKTVVGWVGGARTVFRGMPTAPLDRPPG